METSEAVEAAPRSPRPYARPPFSAGGRRARQDYTCEHCGRDFTAKPVHDQRGVSPRRFCSKRCAGADKTAAAVARETSSCGGKAKREAGTPERAGELINMSVVQALSPSQAAKVRSHIFGLLRVQIPLAHRVVMGEVQWTPTQARVFAAFMHKCIPDLSASFVRSEQSGRDITLLTREELEAIAAGVNEGQDAA